MKMHTRLARTCLVFALISVVALPIISQLPQEKVNELNRLGITDWTPGQDPSGGERFSNLANPITLPAAAPRGATATLQYDDGVISALPVGFGTIFGNRFSLGTGGLPLNTVTLNSFSFYFAEDSTADTGLFFQPADPLNATSIIARASINIGGLVNAGPSFSNLATINVLAQTALGTTGVFNDTFFLGAWCLNTNATVPVDNEAIGLATNAPFRGYTAVSGGAAASVAFAQQSFNAVLRANVTSPTAVPVELMSFAADGD